MLAHEVEELTAAGADRLRRGVAADAFALLQAAAIRRPADAEVRYRLAGALIALGRGDEALAAMALALDLHARAILQANAPEGLATEAPSETLLRLAELFYANNQMTTAAHLYQRLVERHPDHPGLRSRLGLSLQHQGRVEEAVAAFEGLVRRWPTPEHHSALHYAIAFQRTTPDAMFREGRRWAALHAEPQPKSPPRPVRRARGRLRVGYYSPLFTAHQLTKFFAPVMEHHDSARVSVVCYSGSPPSDATAQAIAARADLWREVGALDDQAFAARVAEDGIDVFVDLWGHTWGNRLGVFARRPAPVQVSWLNYIETTGLEEFDYVIHAEGCDLPGAQALYSEEIFTLGPVVAPFRPSHDLPDAGPTPVLANGRMTLGCFGHPAKLNGEVVRTFARILTAVPDAVLVLRSGYFSDPALRRAVHARFEAHAIGPERMVFPAFETGEAFLRAYQGVDLILDPFPYQGFTTALDALSAGAPVLTLQGRYMHDRLTAVTLAACGLPELITTSEDAYVQLAVDLACDPQRLDALRARVKPGFKASPYRQEAAFTRRLEDAFEAMARAKA